MIDKNINDNQWTELKTRLDEHLVLLVESLDVPSERLHDAIKYVLLSSGKRLRPVLIYLTGMTLNVSLEKLDAVACAVECMHAYSLVHDDLPAMDDDDLRRGKPTCHKAFDEATAILAGDALQALAFQHILQVDSPILTAEQKVEMGIILSHACGPQGMVSGQALDLEHLEKDSLTLDLLQKIHQLKTGILLEACINLAIVAAPDANEGVKKNLRAFAKYFGLAFQIQDDYLDAYGETEKLGKQQGADQRQGKKTYVNLYAKQDLEQLIVKTYQQALGYLNEYAEQMDSLIVLTNGLMLRSF